MTWQWYLLCAKGIRHVYVASFIYFFFSLMFATILRLGYGFPHFTQGYVTHSRSCTLSSGWEGIWTQVCLNTVWRVASGLKQKHHLSPYAPAPPPTALSLPRSLQRQCPLSPGVSTWPKKAWAKGDSGVTGVGVWRGGNLAFQCQKLG